MEVEVGQWRTRAVEDFLRTVYLLQQTTIPVRTMMISRTLHIEAPSVTDMMRRLGHRQPASERPNTFYPPTPLLEHKPYHGVRLTPVGEQIALQVIRRRRLLELYLVQMLGYTWDEVDVEADRLEHVISEHLTEQLAIALRNPNVDPHGDPIPTVEGKLPICSADISLTDMSVGLQGMITRIIDYSPELLHYLGDLGLHPGVELHVIGRSPLGDTVTIQVGSTGSTHVLGVQVTDHLRLTNMAKLAPILPPPSRLDYKSHRKIRGADHC